MYMTISKELANARGIVDHEFPYDYCVCFRPMAFARGIVAGCEGWNCTETGFRPMAFARGIVVKDTLK